MKPNCKLTGENGNIFNLAAIASKALRKAGQEDKVKEMQNKVIKSGNYEAAIAVLMEYVEVS